MLAGPLVDRLRQEANDLGGRVPGLRLIALFGSVARSEALPDSDVDIAILGAAHWEALDLGSRLAAILGREPHVVELDHANDLLRFEIARDGLPLWQASPEVWPRFQAESAVRYFDLAPVIRRCAEGARRRLEKEARHG